MKIFALIPARSGSKGIPNKNIMDFHGLPMMAWSINQALECKYIDRVFVSTDSEEYRQIAIEYGAEAPFLRPKEISDDLSTDYECIKHFLDQLEDQPDIIVHLRPTYPTRKASILEATIEIFTGVRSEYDSLRTVVPFEKSPMKMYTIDSDVLNPLFPVWRGIKEPYNRCRQELTQCYLHNGYIDIMNTDTIKKYQSVTGPKIFPFVMDETETNDIDYYKDLK
jgi:N-acylneuraminate cytidylyltransferase